MGKSDMAPISPYSSSANSARPALELRYSFLHPTVSCPYFQPNGPSGPAGFPYLLFAQSMMRYPRKAGIDQ